MDFSGIWEFLTAMGKTRRSFATCTRAAYILIARARALVMSFSASSRLKLH